MNEKSSKDTLGDRMKAYEDEFRVYLPKKSPVIVRLDGRAFHTFTRKLNSATPDSMFEGPFNKIFARTMDTVAAHLVGVMGGAIAAFVQSDEISILLKDWQSEETQPWFGNNLQKIVSISAGEAAVKFLSELKNTDVRKDATLPLPLFDARAFVVPKEDVFNYFIWRGNDCVRNSVAMLAQFHFSHNKLHKVGQAGMKEMLEENGTPWERLSFRSRYGAWWTDDRNFQTMRPMEKSFVEYRDEYSTRLGSLQEFVEDRTGDDFLEGL